MFSNTPGRANGPVDSESRTQMAHMHFRSDQWMHLEIFGTPATAKTGTLQEVTFLACTLLPLALHSTAPHSSAATKLLQKYKQDTGMVSCRTLKVDWSSPGDDSKSVGEPHKRCWAHTLAFPAWLDQVAAPGDEPGESGDSSLFLPLCTQDACMVAWR